MVAVVGVLVGGLGNSAGTGAELEERFVDCAGCLFTAEDVVPGVGAIAVEVVVLVIIRVEVKGAVLPFVAIVAHGVVGVAAQPGAGSRHRAPLWFFQPGLDCSRGGFLSEPKSPAPEGVGGVKAAAQEFLSGGEAVVGLEVGQVARHDVYQEADGGAAVVGLFPDEGGQFLVEGGGV